MYAVTHKDSGKRYIGKSNNIAARWAAHRKDAKHSRGYAIHHAIRKYGLDAFDFEVLEFCDSDADALEAETYWIRWYDTMAPNGYNLTVGGEGGERSAETRRKLSEALKGKPKSKEHRRKLSEANAGVKLSPERVEILRQAAKKRPPVSEETRRRKSASLRGRKLSPEHVEKLKTCRPNWRPSEETRRKMRESQLARWARKREGASE